MDGRGKLCGLLAGGIGLSLLAGVGHLDASVETNQGRLPYWKTDREFFAGNTVRPGLGGIKLFPALGAIACFAAIFPLSYQLEEEEQLEAEQKEFARLKRITQVHWQVEEDNLASQKRLEASEALHEVLAEQEVAERFTKATGIEVDLSTDEPEPAAAQLAITPTEKKVVEESNPEPSPNSGSDRRELINEAQPLTDALSELGHPCTSVGCYKGATYALYLLKPNSPKDIDKILRLGKALQIQLELPKAPLLSIDEGKLAIAIPRSDRQSIDFWDYIRPGKTEGMSLALGVDVKGKLHELLLDARSVESFVMGGIPRSGKSSALLTLISSAAVRYSPSQVQFYLMDGKKGVEFGWLQSSPFCRGFAAFPEEASELIAEGLEEIERRFELFQERGVSNLEEFNALVPKGERLPWLIAIADEFQDLFNLGGMGSETEDLKTLASYASLGPAAGMPLGLATQKPDRTVIKGQVDGKCATRIAFALQRPTDSELVLSGEQGAESLLGKGDMLYKPGTGEMVRLQGLLSNRDAVRPFLFPSTTNSAENA